MRIGKGGRLPDVRLSDQAVRCILETRAGQAGVAVPSPMTSPASTTPSRTFVATRHAQGNDALTVAKLAGNAYVRTPRRYDHRYEHPKRRAQKPRRAVQGVKT